MSVMSFNPDAPITSVLTEQKFALSAEIVPPRNGARQEKIVDGIETLVSGGIDFLSVTKGAGGSLRGGSLPIAQLIKEQLQKPCIAHFTCRDLNATEIENQLMDHHYFGIRNILALRGDPPQDNPDWAPKEGAYTYAHQLIEQIKGLNEGRYLSRKNERGGAGREKTQFCIGAACYPEHPNREERFSFFEKKIQAGADFAITQMIFSPENYAEFVNDMKKRGKSIPILPGMLLLKSKEQAKKISKNFNVIIPQDLYDSLPDKAGDPEQIIDIFSALKEKFQKYGAPGLHLFVLFDFAIARTALEAWQGSTSPEKPSQKHA